LTFLKVLDATKPVVVVPVVGIVPVAIRNTTIVVVVVPGTAPQNTVRF